MENLSEKVKELESGITSSIQRLKDIQAKVAEYKPQEEKKFGKDGHEVKASLYPDGTLILKITGSDAAGIGKRIFYELK